MLQPSTTPFAFTHCNDLPILPNEVSEIGKFGCTFKNSVYKFFFVSKTNLFVSIFLTLSGEKNPPVLKSQSLSKNYSNKKHRIKKT
jgi:hypothetical protein